MARAICRQAQQSFIDDIPPFLLPAFPSRCPVRHFSSSRKCPSRIGRAPLSIPPEVKFQVIPATPKTEGRISRTQPMSTVNIEGPLGGLSSFLSLRIRTDVNWEQGRCQCRYHLTSLSTGTKRQILGRSRYWTRKRGINERCGVC